MLQLSRYHDQTIMAVEARKVALQKLCIRLDTFHPQLPQGTNQRRHHSGRESLFGFTPFFGTLRSRLHEPTGLPIGAFCSTLSVTRAGKFPSDRANSSTSPSLFAFHIRPRIQQEICVDGMSCRRRHSVRNSSVLNPSNAAFISPASPMSDTNCNRSWIIRSFDISFLPILISITRCSQCCRNGRATTRLKQTVDSNVSPPTRVGPHTEPSLLQ